MLAEGHADIVEVLYQHVDPTHGIQKLLFLNVCFCKTKKLFVHFFNIQSLKLSLTLVIFSPQFVYVSFTPTRQLMCDYALSSVPCEDTESLN